MKPLPPTDFNLILCILQLWLMGVMTGILGSMLFGHYVELYRSNKHKDKRQEK